MALKLNGGYTIDTRPSPMPHELPSKVNGFLADVFDPMGEAVPFTTAWGHTKGEATRRCAAEWASKGKADHLKALALGRR